MITATPKAGRGDILVKDGNVKPQYLNTTAAAKYLGIGQSTLERWRVGGTGPKFRVLGAKLVRYSISDLDEFAARETHVCTAYFQKPSG